VSVTCVFCAKEALHVEGQLMPAGELVTFPVPDAGPVTVNWKVAGGELNNEVELPPPHPARKTVTKSAATQCVVWRKRNDVKRDTPTKRL